MFTGDSIEPNGGRDDWLLSGGERPVVAGTPTVAEACSAWGIGQGCAAGSGAYYWL
jgi:hypothetical protein